MVDPKSNLMVVKNSQGTTFDIVVTKMTRLQSADHTVHLKVPERGREQSRFDYLCSGGFGRYRTLN